MNPLTKYGTAPFIKRQEEVMQNLFHLTVRPPKKIEIVQKDSLEYQLVEDPTKPGHYTAVPF